MPPRPAAHERKGARRERARQFLNSGLSLFLRGSYDFIGVSRHPLPRLPFRLPRFAYLVREPDAIRKRASQRRGPLSQGAAHGLHAAGADRPQHFRLQRRGLAPSARHHRSGVRERPRARSVRPACATPAMRSTGVWRRACRARRRERRRRRRDHAFRRRRDLSHDLLRADERGATRARFSPPSSVSNASPTRTAFLPLVNLPTLLLPSNWRGRRDAAAIRRALNGRSRAGLAKSRAAKATPDNDILATLISGADPVTGTRFDKRRIARSGRDAVSRGPRNLGRRAGLVALSDRQPTRRAGAHARRGRRGARRPGAGIFRHAAIAASFATCSRRRCGFIRPSPFSRAKRPIRRNSAGSRSRLMRRRSCRPGSCTATASIGKTPTNSIPTASPIPRPNRRAPAPSCRSAWDRAFVRARPSRLQEATLALAELVRRFEFSPTPGHTPEPVSRLTVRSANGLPLQVKRRSER